jgi:hypothetical protein
VARLEQAKANRLSTDQVTLLTSQITSNEKVCNTKLQEFNEEQRTLRNNLKLKEEENKKIKIELAKAKALSSVGLMVGLPQLKAALNKARDNEVKLANAVAQHNKEIKELKNNLNNHEGRLTVLNTTITKVTESALEAFYPTKTNNEVLEILGSRLKLAKGDEATMLLKVRDDLLNEVKAIFKTQTVLTDSLYKQINDKENENNNIRKELLGIQSRLNDTKKMIDDCKVASEKEKVDMKFSFDAELKEQIKSLNDTCTTEKTSLTAANVLLLASTANAQLQCSQKLAKCETVTKDLLAKKQQEINDMLATHTELTNQFTIDKKGLEALLAAKEQEINEINAMHEGSKKDFDRLLAEKEQEINEINATSNKNNIKLTQQYEEMVATAEAAKQQQINDILANHAAAKKDYDNTLAKYETDKRSLEDKLVEKEQEIFKLQEVNEATKLNHEALYQAQALVNSSTLSLLETKTEELNKLLTSNEDFQTKLAMYEGIQKEQLDSLTKANEENKDLRSKITELELELTDLKQLQLILNPEDCEQERKTLTRIQGQINRKMEMIKKIQIKINNSATQPAVLMQKYCGRNVCKDSVDFTGGLKQYMNDKYTLSNEIGQDSTCDVTRSFLDAWDKDRTGFMTKSRELANIDEDISGSVRVYARIKPPTQPQTSIIDLTPPDEVPYVTVNCGDYPSTYGPFYGVFGTSQDNQAVFDSGLETTFDQVADGYSIVIFGYGLSGSGKTYTLVGKPGVEETSKKPKVAKQDEVKGILQIGLDYLQNKKGVKKFELVYAFEQYSNNFNANATPPSMTDKIHVLIAPQTIGGQLDMSGITKDSTRVANETSSFSTHSVDTLESLSTLLKAIEAHRSTQQRIKETLNNPVSSRSNLYLVFKVTFNTEVIGYVTIVDTAGRENPTELFKDYIKGSTTLQSFILDPHNKNLKKCDAATVCLTDDLQAKLVSSIIKEGFYINEALNHLAYYFKNKNKKTPIVSQNKITPYNTSKFFQFTTKNINGKLVIDKPNDSANLMMPILNFLDSLGKPKGDNTLSKPTKFVTIVCVQSIPDKCDEIKKSLEFAQSISSSA